MEDYATHLPVLAACVAASTGSVLELGSGNFSTPILHTMCKKRNLVTLESDEQWLKNFLDMRSTRHILEYVKDWDRCEWFNKEWDVAFIDHAPGTRRTTDIARLKSKAKIIIVHDTEAPSYRYEIVLPLFKYKYDYKRYHVWTSVVSDFIDVSFLA